MAKRASKVVKAETPHRAATRLMRAAPSTWTTTERGAYWWGAYEALLEVAARAAKPRRKGKVRR